MVQIFFLILQLSETKQQQKLVKKKTGKNNESKSGNLTLSNSRKRGIPFLLLFCLFCQLNERIWNKKITREFMRVASHELPHRFQAHGSIWSSWESYGHLGKAIKTNHECVTVNSHPFLSFQFTLYINIECMIVLTNIVTSHSHLWYA